MSNKILDGRVATPRPLRQHQLIPLAPGARAPICKVAAYFLNGPDREATGFTNLQTPLGFGRTPLCCEVLQVKDEMPNPSPYPTLTGARKETPEVNQFKNSVPAL